MTLSLYCSIALLMNKTLKINDKVKLNDSRLNGVITEIDDKNKYNDHPYLVFFKPIDDYDIENIGSHYEWCNKDELTKY